MATKNDNIAEVNALRAEIKHLEAENRHLRSELEKAGATPKMQTRQCIGCGKNLPDGPAYFPGYLERAGVDHDAEVKRHLCVYCRKAQ